MGACARVCNVYEFAGTRVFESFAIHFLTKSSFVQVVLERLFNVHHVTSCRVLDYFKGNVMLQDPNPRGQERECHPCAGLDLTH